MQLSVIHSNRVVCAVVLVPGLHVHMYTLAIMPALHVQAEVTFLEGANSEGGATTAGDNNSEEEEDLSGTLEDIGQPL